MILLKIVSKNFDLNEKIGANITNNFVTIVGFYEDLTKEEKSKISSSHLYKAFLKLGFCAIMQKHKTKRISKQIMNSILDKKEATKDQETMYLKNIKKLKNFQFIRTKNLNMNLDNAWKLMPNFIAFSVQKKKLHCIMQSM